MWRPPRCPRVKAATTAWPIQRIAEEVADHPAALDCAHDPHRWTGDPREHEGMGGECPEARPDGSGVTGTRGPDFELGIPDGLRMPSLIHAAAEPRTSAATEWTGPAAEARIEAIESPQWTGRAGAGTTVVSAKPNPSG